MSDYRWQGFAHEQLYAWIQAGPGAAASTAPMDFAGKAAGQIAAIDGRLQDAVSKLGVSWSGSAAERATSALAPLSGWAGHTTAELSAIEAMHRNQADTVTQLRAAMPPPVPGPAAGPSGLEIVMASVYSAPLIDWAQQEAAHMEASARAVELMDGYARASGTQQANLGRLDDPPLVIVDGPATAVTPAAASAAGLGRGVGAMPAIAGADAIAPAANSTPATAATPAATVSPIPATTAAAGNQSLGRGPAPARATTAAPPLGTPRPTDGVVIPGRSPGSPLPGVPGGAGLPGGGWPGGSEGRSGKPAAAARELVEPALPPRSAAKTGPGTSAMVPPFIGGAAMGAADREHRRPDYLLEAEDIFAVDRPVVPPVIGG